MKIKILLLLITIFLVLNVDLKAQNNSPANNTLNAGMLILIIAGVLLFIWIVMVIVYLVWAIHRYNSNYGLSDHEWKILNPHMYANEDEMEKYTALNAKMIAEKQSLALSGKDDGSAAAVSLEEPEENPYKYDSFGLPPNTIRGIIALTALFLFVLVEGVNLFSSRSIEGNFDQLIVALQMVIAFYFGSRAVEVFKTKNEKKSGLTEGEEKRSAQALKLEKPDTSKVINKVAERESEEETTIPEEKPILPEEKSSSRIVSTIENSKNFEVPAEKAKKFKNNKAIQNRPLPERILALTGSFETGENFPKCFAGLSNNFDGQGISFGVLQWNIGQGSLQPLLQKMNDKHPDICEKNFGSLYYDFDKMLKMSKPEQLAWAKSIQFTHTKNGRIIWQIDSKWVKAFMNLGITNEMISLQAEAADTIYQKALLLLDEYELVTERGLALMFDIITQNGSVDRKGAGKKIRDDYLKIPAGLSDENVQVEKMIIIANRRSEVANPKYVEDVRSRKLTIAKGEGKVHSKQYNLENEFNIMLRKV